MLQAILRMLFPGHFAEQTRKLRIAAYRELLHFVVNIDLDFCMLHYPENAKTDEDPRMAEFYARRKELHEWQKSVEYKLYKLRRQE